MALLLSALSRVDADVSDAEFFQALELDFPGLGKVAEAAGLEDYSEAKKGLCAYFRQREEAFWWRKMYQPVTEEEGNRCLRAWRQVRDKTSCFSSEQWNPDGSYGWDNGPDAKMSHRMYFFTALGGAYAYSGNEGIARAWLSATGMLLGVGCSQERNGQILFQTDFSEADDLACAWHWEGQGRAALENGKLALQEENGDGVVLWIRQDFPADMQLQFDLSFNTNLGIGVFF
ncbi:MAG: heparinase II/III family protein, partial [Verrucomicrobiota bacterium]|nr:heparinase II/III family protein [Verrucomicrobiota bacterium]